MVFRKIGEAYCYILEESNPVRNRRELECELKLVLEKSGFQYSESFPSNESYSIGIHKLGAKDLFPERRNLVGYLLRMSDSEIEVISHSKELDNLLKHFEEAD